MSKEQFSILMLKFSKVLSFGAPDFKDSDVIGFWYQQLGSFDAQALGDAMMKLCSADKFPSIDKIKAKCGVVDLSDEELARDAIARIRDAVGRFGYNNWDRASEYIGSVGQHLVKIMGGWDEVCAFACYKELDFALTQAREYAKVAIKKSNSGFLTQVPNFPEKQTNTTRLISSIANRMDLPSLITRKVDKD